MPADATIVLPPNSGGPTLDGVANIAVTNSGATVLVAAVYSFSRSLHTLATPSSVLLPQFASATYRNLVHRGNKRPTNVARSFWSVTTRKVRTANPFCTKRASGREVFVPHLTPV